MLEQYRRAATASCRAGMHARRVNVGQKAVEGRVRRGVCARTHSVCRMGTGVMNATDDAILVQTIVDGASHWACLLVTMRVDLDRELDGDRRGYDWLVLLG